MKNGTAYAEVLKKTWKKHQATARPTQAAEPRDPMRCLAEGILGSGVSENQAKRAVDGLLDAMAGWNEVRASVSAEVRDALGARIPNAQDRCQQLIDAMQDVYDRENRLSLDRLRGLGRREARHYLDELRGADAYAVACTVLWGLGGHAIPVNDKLMRELRDADVVHPDASRAEVQAFLERHISASDALSFCVAMRTFTATKGRAASAPSSKKRKAKA